MKDFNTEEETLKVIAMQVYYHSKRSNVFALYGTVHRKHDGNSVCQLALFIVIAPLTVNVFDYLLAFNR